MESSNGGKEEISSPAQYFITGLNEITTKSQDLQDSANKLPSADAIKASADSLKDIADRITRSVASGVTLGPFYPQSAEEIGLCAALTSLVNAQLTLLNIFVEKAALLQETPLLRAQIAAPLRVLEHVADAFSIHIVSLVPGQNERVSEHTTSWADALGNAMAAYA